MAVYERTCYFRLQWKTSFWISMHNNHFEFRYINWEKRKVKCLLTINKQSDNYSENEHVTLNSCNGKIIIPFEDFPHILLLFFRLPSILEVKHNGAVVQRQGKFFQTRFGQFRSDEKPWTICRNYNQIQSVFSSSH